MAQVSYDSAFMKQIVPATSVDYAQDFQVVRDEDSRTLLFSIGSARQLYLLLPQTTNGSTEQLELGVLFGLPSKTSISHLSVLQANDLSIYIAFTAEGAKTGDPSRIYVVRPTKPADWLALKKSDKASSIASWLLNDKSTLQSIVQRVYVVVRFLTLVDCRRTILRHFVSGSASLWRSLSNRRRGALSTRRNAQRCGKSRYRCLRQQVGLLGCV